MSEVLIFYNIEFQEGNFSQIIIQNIQYLDRAQLRRDRGEMYFAVLCCDIPKKNLIRKFKQGKLNKTRP